MVKKIVKEVVLISLITSSINEVYARGYHNPENDWVWLFIIGFFLSYYLIEYIKEKIEQYVYKLKKKNKDSEKRKNINETINESE